MSCDTKGTSTPGSDGTSLRSGRRSFAIGTCARGSGRPITFQPSGSGARQTLEGRVILRSSGILSILRLLSYGPSRSQRIGYVSAVWTGDLRRHSQLAGTLWLATSSLPKTWPAIRSFYLGDASFVIEIRPQ
jgi:hypothetical protein